MSDGRWVFLSHEEYAKLEKRGGPELGQEVLPAHLRVRLDGLVELADRAYGMTLRRRRPNEGRALLVQELRNVQALLLLDPGVAEMVETREREAAAGIS